jgi:hypothetical protein
MSNIQYGLISRVDSDTIEMVIDLICNDFDDKAINICEIGLYNGRTSSGIYEYVTTKKYKSKYTHPDQPIFEFNYKCNYTGIESFILGEKMVFFPEEGTLINGNSIEMYNRIPDNSQHLIFVDGCHCFAHVVSDFFCYAPKVKTGGFIAFHDTGNHIKPFKDFQHGDKDNPDAYISVRKALSSIGLLGRHEFLYPYNYRSIWELVFDKADENDEAGGICCFRKLQK